MAGDKVGDPFVRQELGWRARRSALEAAMGQRLRKLLTPRDANLESKDPGRAPRLVVPCGPFGVCTGLFWFLPQNVLDRETWETLKEDCARLGVGEWHLQVLFLRLCDARDKSWGTVRLGPLLRSTPPRSRRLFRRVLRAQIGHRSRRMLFEDVVRVVLDLCALDFASLVLLGIRTMVPDEAIDLTLLRGVIRFLAADELDEFSRFVFRTLYPEIGTTAHAAEAVIQLGLRYPVVVQPVLLMQRFLQRRFLGLRFWHEFHHREGTGLFPETLSVEDLEAITGRVLVLESVSALAAPFVFGSAATALERPTWGRASSFPTAPGRALRMRPPTAAAVAAAVMVHVAPPAKAAPTSILRPARSSAALSDDKDVVEAAERPDAASPAVDGRLASAHRPQVKFLSNESVAAGLSVLRGFATRDRFLNDAGEGPRRKAIWDVENMQPTPHSLRDAWKVARRHRHPRGAELHLTSAQIVQRVYLQMATGAGRSFAVVACPCLLCGETITPTLFSTLAPGATSDTGVDGNAASATSAEAHADGIDVGERHDRGVDLGGRRRGRRGSLTVTSAGGLVDMVRDGTLRFEPRKVLRWRTAAARRPKARRRLLRGSIGVAADSVEMPGAWGEGDEGGRNDEDEDLAQDEQALGNPSALVHEPGGGRSVRFAAPEDEKESVEEEGPEDAALAVPGTVELVVADHPDRGSPPRPPPRKQVKPTPPTRLIPVALEAPELPGATGSPESAVPSVLSAEASPASPLVRPRARSPSLRPKRASSSGRASHTGMRRSLRSSTDAPDPEAGIPEHASPPAPTEPARRQKPKLFNTGLCAECDTYAHAILADLLGYKKADTILNAATVKPRAVEVVDALGESSRLLHEPMPTKRRLRGDTRRFQFDDDVFLELFDDEARRFFYYNASTGYSTWIQPPRYVPFALVRDDAR